jgi:hypothetical protein
LAVDDRPVRDLTAGCRYVDAMEKRDGRWGIVHRVVVMDWSRLDDVDPRSIAREATGDDEVARDRSGYPLGRPFPHDPSYRH